VAMPSVVGKTKIRKLPLVPRGLTPVYRYALSRPSGPSCKFHPNGMICAVGIE